MRRVIPAILSACLLLPCVLAQTQAPRAAPGPRSDFREAIQQARAIRKSQEAIVAALEAKKATRELLSEQIAVTEKNFQALRATIDKIDAGYDTLTETQKSAVREAWSLAQLFSVFIGYQKASAAKPDSAERERELISDSTSTHRRAVMLDETLSRLAPEGRPRGS